MSPSEQVIKALVEYKGKDFDVTPALLNFILEVFSMSPGSPPSCLHDWDEGHHNISKCKKCGKYSA